MDRPPENKGLLLERVVAELAEIRGVVAVVLGGSYARGMQHEGSDLDVGLYYRDAQRLMIEDIRRVAIDISVQNEPVVTDFYAIYVHDTFNP
jgi:predicted nucleotidyltransferase